MTEQRLQEIREWYARHRDDYDSQSPHSPPRKWSEYFAELLALGARGWQPADCTCDGGPQGEGLVSLPHEPHCPLHQGQ